MFIVHNESFDVPASGSITSSEGVAGFSAILHIREGSDFNRTILFRNKCTSEIDVVVQENDGSGWLDIYGLSFELGAVASGSEVLGGLITSDYILRILAKGGCDAKDLEIGYCSMVVDDNGLDDDLDTLRSPTA
jgi:hypothetical protein